MNTLQGKTINEIDIYADERKKVYLSLIEEILISSYRYNNDFSKFMIGLNSVMLTAYMAILKIGEVKLSLIVIIPFILQIITIIFYLITIYPRQFKNIKKDKPLIFTPEVILEVYQQTTFKKRIWNFLGSIVFTLYLISIVFVTSKIIN